MTLKHQPESSTVMGDAATAAHLGTKQAHVSKCYEARSSTATYTSLLRQGNLWHDFWCQHSRTHRDAGTGLGTPANPGRRRRGAPLGRWSTVLPGPANQRRLPWRKFNQRSVLAELQFLHSV